MPREPFAWVRGLFAWETWTIWVTTVVVLAFLGMLGGVALSPAVEPLARDAAFRTGGQSVEAMVIGVVDGRAEVSYVADGVPVRTEATGAYNPIEDGREVTIRYLPSSPEEASLRVEGAAWQTWTALVVTVVAVAGLPLTWYRTGRSDRERGRLRRQAPPRPVARWGYPALFCLFLGLAILVGPYLRATPGEMVEPAPTFTWFTVGTAVLLFSWLLAWRALYRHALLNRPVPSELGDVTVGIGLVVACLAILALPGHFLLEYLRLDHATAEGHRERGTIIRTEHTGERGCRVDVTVGYEVNELPHRHTFSLGCAEARDLRSGDEVEVRAGREDPRRVRLVD